MSDVVIRATGLGKKYAIGHTQERPRYTALRDVIVPKARNVLRATSDALRGRAKFGERRTEEIWALKDVSFEIKRGEVVGIIGRNGAGKSTLLKVLSRITEVSEGRVEIRGRVGSLLEVGTGFHPELTGRENIFLNGAILGMTRAEIKRKFDEIVAFSEVEKFLDTPVKRYSSGMYVRLAFAVAAHLEPEILVVDEVLAVGDNEFQKKCLGKMRDVAGEGRTVLFVSHNMAAVRLLCQNALLFVQGKLAFRGPTSDALAEYTTTNENRNSFRRPTTKSSKPQIVAADIDNTFRDDRKLHINLCVFSELAMSVEIAALFREQSGNMIGFAPLGSLMSESPVRLTPGNNEFIMSIDVSSLAVGSYLLSLDLTKPFIEFYDRCEDCLTFDIGAEHFSDVKNPLRQDWRMGSVLFKASISKSSFRSG